jgi:hypothetical protein
MKSDALSILHSLKRMRSHLLILHAEDDHIVPIHMAQQVWHDTLTVTDNNSSIVIYP